MWNRQRTDFDLVDPANTGLGHRQVQRWNLPAGFYARLGYTECGRTPDYPHGHDDIHLLKQLG